MMRLRITSLVVVTSVHFSGHTLVAKSGRMAGDLMKSKCGSPLNSVLLCISRLTLIRR